MSPTKTGLIPMLIFWCVLMGLLYLLMDHYQKPRQAQVLANGDVVLERAPDGHFYAMGMVNGQAVRFLVDTGATVVGVSQAFADKAALQGGVPTAFKTANGLMSGRIIDGVPVSLGPLSVSRVSVGVGLSGMGEDEALLGQSFLSHFDMRMNKNQLVLHAR